jgi:hypothetical protein
MSEGAGLFGLDSLGPAIPRLRDANNYKCIRVSDLLAPVFISFLSIASRQ